MGEYIFDQVRQCRLAMAISAPIEIGVLENVLSLPLSRPSLSYAHKYI